MYKELYEKALITRKLYRTKIIDKKTALEELKEFINVFNELSLDKAKKYKQKPKLFNFSAFMR
jgi:hypothetical protein